jgi:hypothetical protein
MTLADRIEGLDGPSREVDAEIFRAIGAPVPFQFANKLIALEFNDVEQAYFARVSDDMRVRFSPPAYTASMDAVRTLIDPSDEWEVSTMYNIARATVGLNRDNQTSWPGHGEHAGCDTWYWRFSPPLSAPKRQRGGGGELRHHPDHWPRGLQMDR